MRRLILAIAATGLSAIGLSSASAIDVKIGGEAGVDITIGVGVGAGVGGDEGGAGAGVGVGVEAGAGAAAGAGEGNAPPTEIMIRTEGGAEATLVANALVGQSVFTNDGAEIGTVAGVTAAADGSAQLLVALTAGWMEGVENVAISLSAMIQAGGQLVVDTDEADLRASIQAGLAAGAAG
jgi:hypothetical protein